MKLLINSITGLLLLILSTAPIFGQENEDKDNVPRYYLHNLADTARNPAHAPIIEHWVDFLYTENDSLRKTYWNPADIERWGNRYAMFYGSLFQYPVKDILAYAKPYILSVHCDGDNFCRIATLFMNFKSAPSDTSAKYNSNPLCIVEVGLYHEDGKMYLTNLFDQRTAGWKKFTAGKVNYIVEPNLEPNRIEAQQAVSFADSLARVFDTDYDTITYLVCNSPNDIGYVLGFNFFFMGVTQGMVIHEARMIFSGLGTFNYPHEIAHLIIDPQIKGGSFFSEGLTTFFGGSATLGRNETFEELLPEFKKQYLEITDSTFKQIIAYPGFPAAYTLGGLVVEYIYREKGIDGLKSLSGGPTDTEEFVDFATAKMGIDKATLFMEINERLSQVKE